MQGSSRSKAPGPSRVRRRLHSSTTRQAPRRRVGWEYPLAPRVGSWSDLIPDAFDEATALLYVLLDEGVVEAWQDDRGAIRFYDGKTGKAWTT